MTLEQIYRLAKKLLDEERLIHTQGVALMGKMLAQRYGAAEEKVEMAAWSHDLFRRTAYNVLCQRCKKWGMSNPEQYLGSDLLHGPAAALYVKQKGMQDQEILDAIWYHTSGRINMSLLEKIIFVADKCEPNRKYAQVTEWRKKAEHDLSDVIITIQKSNGEKYKNDKIACKI